MAQLAIKGHETRGSEVIELLRMLGGVNVDSHKGSFPDEWKSSYYIYGDNTIQFARDEFLLKLNFVIFTLEEFLEKYPYKVGDKVERNIDYISCFINGMRWDCNRRCVEYHLCSICGNDGYGWHIAECLNKIEEHDANNMNTKVETLVRDIECEAYFRELNKEKMSYTKNELIDLIPTSSDKAMIIVKDGFEIIEEQGEFFVKEKKHIYPKTYNECKKMLGEYEYYGFTVLMTLQNLIICRNVYWKIYGEQIGLGKPWEPDLENEELYCIQNYNKQIIKSKTNTAFNKILIFPTSEMRDAFYENFKDLIEKCKELL